ncbi:MAG: DNA translocase FtsK 4TM domain-containing protein, partial [Clostridia bacterium]|nr:DNA translocase FtsK 4TM domain-containing protein [Clostridia bacterium]
MKKKSKNTQKFAIDSSVQAILLFSLSLLVFFLVVIPGENFWLWMHNLILNIFGMPAIMLSVILGYISVKIATQKTERLELNIVILSVLLVFVCSLFYIFSNKLVVINNNNWLKYIINDYKNSKFSANCGLIGSLAGGLLVWICGLTGARIVSIIIIFIGLMIITRTSLIQVLNTIF